MSRVARRALSLLTASALLAGLFLGTPAPVRAAETVYVGHHDNDYVPGSECANPDYWTDGDWTGGGPYNSDNDAIQDAADNAVSGSVIYICAGNYVFAELVTIGAGKNITFRGEGDATVLDGNDITRIFNASPVNESDQGGVLSLRDLLIMDAEVTEWNAGAIVADGLSLDNVTITRTTGAYNGGALYAEGNVTIVDSTFTDNIASADGGVLYAWNGDRTVSISNSVFDGNTAGFQGGAISATTVTVIGSTFTDSDASFGGAISANSATVTNSTFTGSSAVSGGAVGAVTVTVANSTFTNNEGSNCGGAIYVDVTATVTNSTFSGNSSDCGGAIYSYDTATVANSTFTNNSSTIGGAIYADSTATVSNSTFRGNTADFYGGAIYADSTATVSASTFRGNTADFYGGAIFSTTNTVTSSTFISNSAILGGAIRADTATVTSSTFTSNTSVNAGGAIQASATATVSNSTFTRNTSVNQGGAISASTGAVAGSRFTRNTSGTHGGAIYFSSPAPTDLRLMRRNSFSRNTAAVGGAMTLGPCGTPSRSQAARVERANRFSGNRATEQRRTNSIERLEGGCT